MPHEQFCKDITHLAHHEKLKKLLRCIGAFISVLIKQIQNISIIFLLEISMN